MDPVVNSVTDLLDSLALAALAIVDCRDPSAERIMREDVLNLISLQIMPKDCALVLGPNFTSLLVLFNNAIG